MPPRTLRRYRPFLELLEDRTLLANYTVINLGDAGTGTGNSGDLRYVLTTANTVDGPHTISWQGGLQGTISIGSQLPTLSKEITINGPGADKITVVRTGQANYRIFNINVGDKTAVIKNLTIVNGRVVDDNGGGIAITSGNVTIEGVVLSGNAATNGGGLYSFSGTVTVKNSTISGNTATGAAGRGGGIYFVGTKLTVQDASVISGNTAKKGGGIHLGNDTLAEVLKSTISGNTAQEDGGGIYNATSKGDALKVTSSTISGNTGVSGKGGGVYNTGKATLTNATISGNTAKDSGGIHTTGTGTTKPTNVTENGNTATGGGGGMGRGGGMGVDPGGIVEMVNTLIAGNFAGISPDVDGSVLSDGHNLIGDGTGGTGFLASDLVGTSSNPINPQLGPLANNGGPTPTQTLLAGSPALNAGDSSYVTETTDQRGFARIVGAAVDIGAVEMQTGEVPAQITGRSWGDANANGIQDTGEVGVSGVVVHLYTQSGTLVGTTATNTSGYYTFAAVAPGNYYLVFDKPSPSSVFSPEDQGGDDTRDSDVNANGITAFFSLLSGDIKAFDAGLTA